MNSIFELYSFSSYSAKQQYYGTGSNSAIDSCMWTYDYDVSVHQTQRPALNS